MTINTLSQLYFMLVLRDSQPNTYQSKITNLVNATTAGMYVTT